VELELTGEVKPVDGRSDGGMIVDFGDVKKAFEATCGFLDHRFLCPLRNRDVNVLHAENEFVTIQYLNTGQELCLPRSNVAFVDVENTTAELLAAFIYERLIFLVPELTAVRVWETPTAFAEVRP
jgi:6-pyruvoyl-tetrahydropterin synthase